MQLARAFAVSFSVGLVFEAGCFGPQISEGLACKDNVCPLGQVCVDAICVSEFDPGGDSSADAAIGIDAGANDGASSSRLCESWSETPVYFDPCDLELELEENIVLSAGQHRFDTSARTLVVGTEIMAVDTRVVSLPGGGSAVLWAARSIELQAGATLRAIGNKPLIIAALETVDIDGEIDASSSGSQAGSGSGGLCQPAGAGSSVGDGSSGGGGGGFGGAGARGGNSGGGDPLAGGAGATATTGHTIRGGCAGGRGGSPAGDGGFGGGGIHLVAGGALTVRGVVNAGGGGGGPALSSLGGGGGGGSGGYIGLEGPTVLISSGSLAANGGGGGGVGDSSPGSTGTSGLVSTMPADGGQGAQPGGRGGSRGSPSRQGTGVSLFFAGGGGGGGGGVGKIVAFDPVTLVNETVSPPLEMAD